MINFFKKIPFHAKLLVIGLLPITFLLVVSVQLHQQRNEKIAVTEATLKRLEQSVAVVQLIDALQAERRYGFNYAITQKVTADLTLSRNQTDAAISELENMEQEDFGVLKDYTFLNRIEQIRKSIDEGNISPMEVMNYYTNTIFRINTLANINTSNIPFMALVNKDIVGQRLLSEMVTYLGILRASIYFSLYTKQGLSQADEQLRSLNDIYKSYITEFSFRASKTSVNEFNEVMSSEEMKATNKYINSIFSKGHIDSTYSPEDWWIVSAKGVDKIKKLQRSSLQGVVSKLNAIYETEKEARDRNLVFLVAIVGLVLLIIGAVSKSISDSLNEIRAAALKISAGETGIALHVPSRDVIGTLATSILEVDKNNRKLAAAADAIGKRNFDTVVATRSEHDILGNAIVAMKQDLQQFNTENQKKIWIQSGLSGINDAVRGDKDVSTITANVTDVLVGYLNAQVALFYVSHNREGLYYSYGYAVTDTENVPGNIPYGSSLIGQAAVDKKIVSLADVPDEFVKIRTASGSSLSRYVLVIPLVHNDEVEGVIEIGSLQSFSTDVMAFLEQASTNIAIALQAAKSKARLQELLEETQAQSEELQAQHNELENLNAELEAQAQKLQASEEELKVQQEELLQSNQELEERSRLLEERNQLIAERNLEIQKKAEELEMSTRYKSEFLANMSHELRTPLNSILLLSRLLAENHDHNLSGDQIEYAQVIQSSGTGLLALIDEILDLSKIEAGKMELEYDQVNLKDISEEMRRLFAPIADDKKVALKVDIKDSVAPFIETDKLRLEQILKNLLSNAIKFTQQGSVTLAINNSENEGFIDISVKDTGIGIPKEKQQLIFEAFQQADGSTRRKFGGTGLGLSISRELARLLGGNIRLVSEPEKGSEFILTIPKDKHAVVQSASAQIDTGMQDYQLTQAEAATKPSQYISSVIPEAIPDDRAIVRKNDKVLLIVEDDTGFAKALLDLARAKGYKGIVSVRGDEGIELAKHYIPTGILLDVELPVKSGWEVMEELKTDVSTRHIPVHIMSSHTVKKESLMKGAIDFIDKPVTFEKMQDIFNKIEHVLNKESKKVLIIEENTKHAKALAYFLGSYNVNTEISVNITGSVEALNKEDVDCVILDMGIPDINAYNALESIKETSGLDNLPIIVFTGKSLSKTEEERLRQYADTIVVKTAHSYKRILDEVNLFLHLVEQKEDKKAPGRMMILNEVLRNKKILITDDDVRNIFSLTKALEAHQMNVYSATDGKEALKVLQENPDINVVLMDIMMPEMDGYETMKQIRSRPQFRSLPVIAVTAKAMVGDREKCIKAGASDYISKPVDVDQLLSLLRVWLYDKS